VIAYKFLREGPIGPFSGFQWPERGVWVRTREDPASCRAGIHACRVRDLPWWLANELWEIELDGLIPDSRISLLMAGDGAACALIHAAPMSAYVAAHAARGIGGSLARDAERRWQSEWLARRLGLQTQHCR
jgi:hypothetical protein